MKKEKEEKLRVLSEGNNLAFFLNQISRIPMLSREEEDITAREAAAGNKAAREKLINTNLRFVVNIAKKYQGQGMPIEDLIAEGNIGLMNAVDRFDAEKNCRFISYAVWWIRQSIMKALCEKSRMIRLPTNRANELIRIEKAKRFLRKQPPQNYADTSEEEVGEIAKLLNMNSKHVKELMSISRDMLSLDNSVSKDNELMLKNIIEDKRYITPEKITEQRMMEEEIENTLNTLDGHEADVIRCHFGLGRRKPMSLQEIGDRFNLSKERIRQIEERALRRLKNPARNQRLREYVA